MKSFVAKVFRVAHRLVLGSLMLAAGGGVVYMASAISTAASGRTLARTPPSLTGEATDRPPAAEGLRRCSVNEVVVPADMAALIGLHVTMLEPPSRSIRLPGFQGVLALDSDALSRVHSRFGGEVVELGSHAPRTTAGVMDAVPKVPLRVGDPVRKGDLLAVVWSTDLGQKKSELVSALTNLRAQEQLLARLRKLYEDGAGSARSYRDIEKEVQASRVEVAKAERTLRTWRLTDADLAEIRAEADRILTLETALSDLNDWARVEVRAPWDGVILEKNIAVGDIVDTATDLFKIGDISHLAVWAHVYEEDLSLIESLPLPLPWTVALPSRPGTMFLGTLDKIGAVIDPMQHTALVCGQVANPSGDLKAGQFVTVMVELQVRGGEVELPAMAVVEDGRESIVFVQSDPAEFRFVRHAVSVVRRFRDVIYIRATENGVQPGDRVLTAGALLLRDAMEQLPVPVRTTMEAQFACGDSGNGTSQLPAAALH